MPEHNNLSGALSDNNRLLLQLAATHQAHEHRSANAVRAQAREQVIGVPYRCTIQSHQGISEEEAGLLSGMAFSSIVVGLLIGPTVFGLLLVGADSYRASWAAFAAIATLVTLAAVLAGPAIDRETLRPR